MGFIREFQEFIKRGNMVELAVGVIIGASFGAIIKSLVDDIFMPIIGILIGGYDLSAAKIILKAATDQSAEVAITYGKFLQSLLNFAIIAFFVFWVIKVLNRFNQLLESKKTEPETPSTPPADITLLTEIRDLLKGK